MKIAVITYHVPSHKAHSVNTIKTAEGFFRLGHEVEVLIVRRVLEAINKIKFKDIHKFYGIEKEIEYKYFTDKSVSFLKEGRFLRGFSYKLSKIIKKFLPRIDDILDPERKISEYCKKNKVDLAFCRGTERAAFYNILNKIPTVIENHDNTKRGINPNLKKVFILSKNRYFRGLITIHEVLKKYFGFHGIPKEKVFVHEDVVDLNEFTSINYEKSVLRKKLNLPIEKKLILYTGNMRLKGGINTILEAAQIINNKNYSFYIIGGNASQIKFWKKFATKNNINADINIIGSRPHKIIPYYLKAADILLAIFSKKDPVIKFVSPMKMFEYMASKNPMIVSKWRRTSELCSKNECLFTVLDDPKDLSEKIVQLISNKDLQKKLIINAYKTVINFTYNKRCQKILEFISLDIE